MSQQSTVKIKCPFCASKQSSLVWNSINCTTDPDLREQLMAKKVNQISCNKCHADITLNEDLLYHDMKNMFMIWLKFSIKKEEDIKLSPAIRLLKMFQSQKYKYRLVKTSNQLIEKIFIFENNLNDLSIEIIKISMFSNYEIENFPIEDRVYFQRINKKSNNSSEMVFILFDKSSNREEMIIDYSIYLETNDKVQKYLFQNPENNSNWVLINKSFAMKVMADILGQEYLQKEHLHPYRPDGTIVWQDKSGHLHEQLLPPEKLKDFFKKSDARKVYRILIKDPFSEKILENYLDLGPKEVNNFVDENDTAYCIVVYEKGGDRKLYLIKKEEWLRIPGYSFKSN